MSDRTKDPVDFAHIKPCAGCGHRAKHGEALGCLEITNLDPPRWCGCDRYVRPSNRTARVIPSRNTDPATSHAAAAAVTIGARSQRARLLAAWGRLDDATDEEAMEAAIGVSAFSEYAKRSSELREAGLIELTGDTRPGRAGTERIVSKITQLGREVLGGLS